MANETDAVKREGAAEAVAEPSVKAAKANEAEQRVLAQIASGGGVPAGWEYSPYAATPVRKSKG